MDSPAYMESLCTNIIEWSNERGKDYVFFTVEPYPNVTLEIGDMTAAPGAGTKISILSHPKARPLEWSNFCSVLKLTGAFKLKYECDTEGRSSGAPVFDSNGKMLAIHRGEAQSGGGVTNDATLLKDTPVQTLLTK